MSKVHVHKSCTMDSADRSLVNDRQIQPHGQTAVDAAFRGAGINKSRKRCARQIWGERRDSLRIIGRVEPDLDNQGWPLQGQCSPAGDARRVIESALGRWHALDDT